MVQIPPTPRPHVVVTPDLMVTLGTILHELRVMRDVLENHCRANASVVSEIQTHQESIPEYVQAQLTPLHLLREERARTAAEALAASELATAATIATLTSLMYANTRALQQTMAALVLDLANLSPPGTAPPDTPAPDAA